MRGDIPKRDWLRISQNLWIISVELWCWRRLLRVPWTARRSNRSILKEISPEYSLEGLILRLKFQYFGHLMQRVNSLENTLMLEKIEGRRRSWWQRMRWLDGIINSFSGYEFEQTPRDGEGQGGLACYSPWGLKQPDMTRATEPQHQWMIKFPLNLHQSQPGSSSLLPVRYMELT